ncbi:MAG: DUF2630 family protein [Candidatus Limnocylindrales bacterium]
MQDHTIFERINALSVEEEQLWQAAGDGDGLATADRARLETIRVALDQCYDLLRQRDARRAAGMDPDEAKVRPAKVVEGYEQ